MTLHSLFSFTGLPKCVPIKSHGRNRVAPLALYRPRKQMQMIDVRLSYNTVTSDTREEFVWENQTNIEFHRVLHDITDEELEMCRESLKNVKFSSLTKISNLISILDKCPNVENLTFDDAIIDEYRPITSNSLYSNNLTSFPLVVHQNLAVLIIICPWGLTKNEYWLLDFFTTATDLPRLTSLSFYSYTTIGGVALGPHPRPLQQNLFKENTEVMEKFGTFATDNIVPNFLLKFRSTLRRLWLGRPGFTLPIDQELIAQLSQLNLLFLSVSLGSSGVQFLLETQRELETLNLVSNLRLHRGVTLREITENLNQFYDCVARNAGTLKEVKLVPTIIAHASRDQLLREDDILEVMKINCEIFSQCSRLQYLCLSLRGYRDDMDMWMDLPPILQGTKLNNLHQIPPTTLIELYLPVEDFNLLELEMLGRRFHMFYNLRKLYFGTSQLNPLNPFLVRIPWVQALVNLPKIEKIVFHNGILQDVDAIRRMISSISRDGMSITMNYTAPRYTFEFHRPVRPP